MPDGRAPVRVFISYAHDHPAHEDRVRRFWLFLRGQGVDARLDLSVAGQRVDWAEWMTREVRDADRVLVIASPEYKRRAEGDSGSDEGRGVQWEARLIRDVFYANQRRGLDRVVPVVLPGGSVRDLPLWLAPASTTHYVVRDFTVPGAEALLRLLTEQPLDIAPSLGDIPVLPPRGSAPPRPRRTFRLAGVIASAAIIIIIIVIGVLVARSIASHGPPARTGHTSSPTATATVSPTRADGSTSAASPSPSVLTSPPPSTASGGASAGSAGLVRDLTLPLKPAGQIAKISLAFGPGVPQGLNDGDYARGENNAPELNFNGDPFKLDVSARAAQDECSSELLPNSPFGLITNLRKGLLICVESADGNALLQVMQAPGPGGTLVLRETYWPSGATP